MKSRVALFVDRDLAVWIQTRGGDHYWMFGTLEPGRGYRGYGPLPEPQLPWIQHDETDDNPSSELKVRLDELLETIRDRSRPLADPPKRIRDLNFIDDETTIESKIDPWI